MPGGHRSARHREAPELAAGADRQARRVDLVDRLNLVGAFVAMLVVGVVIGIITTLAHRSWPPLGLILGLVVVVAFVAGLRLFTGARSIAVGGALGIIIALVTLAAPGTAGAVYVVDDWLGWGWVLVAPLLLAVVLTWPSALHRAHR